MHGKIVEFGSGFWGPAFDEPYQVVGTFLMQDIQRCSKSCDLYMHAALDIAAGNDGPREVHGNGHIVRIMSGLVLIGDKFGQSVAPVAISTDAFVRVIRYWKSIVAAWDKSNPPVDPPEFNYDDPEPSPPLSADLALREFKFALSEEQDSRRRARKEKGDIEIIRGHHRDYL